MTKKNLNFESVIISTRLCHITTMKACHFQIMSYVTILTFYFTIFSYFFKWPSRGRCSPTWTRARARGSFYLPGGQIILRLTQNSYSCLTWRAQIRH